MVLVVVVFNSIRSNPNNSSSSSITVIYFSNDLKPTQ